MKNVKGSFKVPIYEVRIYVALAPTIAEGVAMLPIVMQKISDKLGCHESTACYMGEWPNFALIFTQGKCSLGTVAHEIGHVSRKILADIGFKIEESNDEPLAYLEEYVTDKVHAILKK